MSSAKCEQTACSQELVNIYSMLILRVHNDVLTKMQ